MLIGELVPGVVRVVWWSSLKQRLRRPSQGWCRPALVGLAAWYRHFRGLRRAWSPGSSLLVAGEDSGCGTAKHGFRYVRLGACRGGRAAPGMVGVRASIWLVIAGIWCPGGPGRWPLGR